MFWGGHHGADVFSGHHIRADTMLTCLTTADVNTDHSVKVVSARFLHCKVAIFLFVINLFVGRYFKTLQISCFSFHSFH